MTEAMKKTLQETFLRPLNWIVASLAVGTLAAGSGAGIECLQNLFGFVIPALAWFMCVVVGNVAARSQAPSASERDTAKTLAWASLLMMIVSAAVGWYWTAGAWTLTAFIAAAVRLDADDDQ